MRKLYPLFFLIVLVSAIPLVNAVTYTPLTVFEYYDENVDSRMFFDGANYIYVTPYGNYTFLQPSNLMKFTDYNGIDVIDKSVFILQYNSFGSWLPLLDFYDSSLGDPVVTIANETYFQLDYNIYDKKVIMGNVTLKFKINSNVEINPKIDIGVSLSENWDKGPFRWIWDIVPDNNYYHYTNQTSNELVDVRDFNDLKELYNTTQPRLKIKNSINNINLIIDVSDYGGVMWYGGLESNWNSKGFVSIFPVNESSIDPTTYAETAPELIDETGWVGGWQLNEDCGSAPTNSIAEIIAVNNQAASTVSVGVRNTTSTIERLLELNEAEDGGVTATRFLVSVDSSGNCDFYDPVGDTDNYYLVGYWEGVGFTEQWVQYNTLSSEDDMWHETDGSELSLQSNRTHLISLINANTGTEDFLGVRNTSSILDRRILIMESEGGGVQTASMYVQVDSSSKIDVYTWDFADVYFINQGYFDETVNFTEHLIRHDFGFGGWEDWDLSAYIDEDGKIVDVFCGNGLLNNEATVGVRENGSILERKIQIRESEGSGYNGFGMSVNTDISGIIEGISDTDQPFWYSGYFSEVTIPSSPPFVGNVSLLFGAGFNWSTPYVYIKWEYTGNVTNYEVTHSTDNVTYTHLAYTPNKNYTHTGLVNGSIHYYRVRSTYFSVGWFNSSYSPRNLERVWFIPGAGGAVITVTYTYEYREYNISSWDNITGFVNYGSFNDIAFVDSLNQSIQEVVGVPAFDMRYNFTGIPSNTTALNILIRAEYTGNQAHIVWVRAWNFTGQAWADLILIPDCVRFRWFNSSLSAYKTEDFLNNGSVWIKIDHVSAGNINHVLLIDYVRLRGIVPIILEGELLNPWDINWLTALIWLALVGIGVFSRSKILIVFSGFFGLILGIILFPENSMVSIGLIFLNFYLIYTGST